MLKNQGERHRLLADSSQTLQYPELLKPPIAALGVWPFRFAPLLVFLLHLLSPHPLAPSRNLRAVARLRGVRVFPLSLLLFQFLEK